jgi:hypothetical protein
MPELVTQIDIIGYWLGIFLTFCILSFLYKDNPFYKFAEHLFVGVSLGFLVMQQYFDVIHPYLVEKLAGGEMLALVPLLLCIMLFMKALSRRLAWVARYPLALVVALYAGFAIKTVEANLGAQLKESTQSLDAPKVNINTATPEELAALPGVSGSVAEKIVQRRAEAPFQSVDQIAGLPGLTEPQRDTLAQERGHFIGLDARAGTADGERDLFGIFSEVLLLLGLIASLVYFYFSIEQKGAVKGVSRFGVWILMIGFGASFGYTVQGRLSLAIGRAMDVLGKDKDPVLADRIQGPLVAVISIAIIVTGILLWELKLRRVARRGPPPAPPPAEGATT